MKDTYLLSDTFHKFMNILKDTDNKVRRGYIITFKLFTSRK